VGQQKGYLGAGANKDHELAVLVNQCVFSGLTVSRHQFENYLLPTLRLLLTAQFSGCNLTPMRNRIRVLRAERELNQWQLAQKIGVGRDKIHRFERGYAEPNESERRALAAALETTEQELFPEPPQAP